jgi:hypothetical protein
LKKAEESRRQDAQVTYDNTNFEKRKKKRNKLGEELSEYESETNE